MSYYRSSMTKMATAYGFRLALRTRLSTHLIKLFPPLFLFLLPVEATAPAIDRALAFVDAYGGSFGLRGRGQAELLRAPTRDELGLDHVRLQQMYQGLPVRGGELIDSILTCLNSTKQ